jgi:hypothetical protein
MGGSHLLQSCPALTFTEHFSSPTTQLCWPFSMSQSAASTTLIIPNTHLKVLVSFHDVVTCIFSGALVLFSGFSGMCGRIAVVFR